MPGISDSGQADDVRVHLETIMAADDTAAAAPADESEEERAGRVSVQLRGLLRARLTKALAEVSSQAPGISQAEVAKLTATRVGKHALRQGQEALARIDSHLPSITDEVNSPRSRAFGVCGSNPQSFAGVYRALELSAAEQDRLEALATEDPEREFLLSPVIARAVRNARDHLRTVLGTRLASRADLSRRVDLKSAVMSEANATISAVRNHLYANLPRRQRDPDLRDYGFRPIQTGRTRSGEEVEIEAPEASA